MEIFVISFREILAYIISVLSPVKLCRVKGSILMELVDHTDVIRDLNFAPDASLRLVSASRDGTLRVWQLHDGRINGSVSSQWPAVCLLVGGQSKWMYGCCWSPDANLLASVGDSRSVRLFISDFVLLWFFYSVVVMSLEVTVIGNIKS